MMRFPLPGEDEAPGEDDFLDPSVKELLPDNLDDTEQDNIAPDSSEDLGPDVPVRGLQGAGGAPAGNDPAGLRAYAWQAALKAGIDPNIFTRQINQESGFRPGLVSPAGAVGIAQIVPHYHPEVDATDPRASLDWAAQWMEQLLKQYGGDYRQALVHYNGGGGAVSALQAGQPYSESQRYLNAILGSEDSQAVSPPPSPPDNNPPPPEPGPEGRAPPPIPPPPGRAGKVPTLNDALNDAATRFGGISWDGMSADQRKTFRILYGMLDMSAISQFQKGYRFLSPDQRESVVQVFSTGDTDPAAFMATLGHITNQYQTGQMSLDDYKQALLQIGVAPFIVARYLFKEAPQLDSKLLTARASSLQAQFRAGTITAEDYQKALVDTGVRPAIAEAFVNRDAALKQMRELPSLIRAQTAVPRPLAAERTPPRSNGLTWPKAVVMLDPADLDNLTDAWRGGSDGVSAVSPLRWRAIMNMLGANSAPALAAQLRSLWQSAGGQAVPRSPGGPSPFSLYRYESRYLRIPNRPVSGGGSPGRGGLRSVTPLLPVP